MITVAMVKLVLRTLNDAKTAYGVVELRQGMFFQEYSLRSRQGIVAVHSGEMDEPFLGKIQLKVC